MKNLRKTGCMATALILVFALGGCVTGSNVPRTGTTGYGIGTGTAIVPGTTAITGTNTGMNIGTNLGSNLRRNLGTNLGTNTAIPGTNLTGTNLTGTTGTGVVPNELGTAGKAYKDGTYTATGANGTDNATLTIYGGKITKVDFTAANGRYKAGLKAIRDDISNQVISKQNTPAFINCCFLLPG